MLISSAGLWQMNCTKSRSKECTMAGLKPRRLMWPTRWQESRYASMPGESTLTTLSSSVKAGLDLLIGEMAQQPAGSYSQSTPGDNVTQGGVAAALAIRYREIVKHKDWLHGTESYQIQALHGTDGAGVFGGHKEREEDPESESDVEDSENRASENSQIGKPQAAIGESSKDRMDEETVQLEQGKLEKPAGQVGFSKDTEPTQEAKSTEKAEIAEEEEVSNQDKPPDSKDEMPVEEAHVEEAKSTDKAGATEGEKVQEQENDSALEDQSEQCLQKLARERANRGDRSGMDHVAGDEFELGSGLPLGQIGELVVVNFLQLKEAQPGWRGK